MQCTATYCNTLQQWQNGNATQSSHPICIWKTLQCTATYCNRMQQRKIGNHAHSSHPIYKYAVGWLDGDNSVFSSVTSRRLVHVCDMTHPCHNLTWLNSYVTVLSSVTWPVRMCDMTRRMPDITHPRHPWHDSSMFLVSRRNGYITPWRDPFVRVIWLSSISPGTWLVHVPRVTNQWLHHSVT